MLWAPLSRFPEARAAKVRAVFTDIDDTLTVGGQLTESAYRGLWRLHDLGIAVVPVTGRPAGWCDQIARMWPVAGVVGENGAFYFRYDRRARKMLRAFVLSRAARDQAARRLDRLAKRILREVPGAGISTDQPYRIHDLAVDFCEDVPALPRDQIDRIVAIFEKAGATAKVSSIHVNGWFGTWDKVGMIKRIASEVLDLDLERPAHNRRAIYVGDSPNDEPAFAFFEQGIGVANIRDFEDRLVHPPAYVASKRGGDGFAQVVSKLVRARRTRAQ